MEKHGKTFHLIFFREKLEILNLNNINFYNQLLIDFEPNVI